MIDSGRLDDDKTVCFAERIEIHLVEGPFFESLWSETEHSISTELSWSKYSIAAAKSSHDAPAAIINAAEAF